jgi:hypothetical protein
MFSLKEKLFKTLYNEEAIKEIEEKLKGVKADQNPPIDFLAQKDQTVIIRNLGTFFKKKHDNKLKEENDDSNMKYYDMYNYEEEEKVKKNYFGSYSALNFIAKGVKCHLDDLADLLTNSQKYQNALAQIKNSGDLYKDPEFHPDINSLCGYSSDFNDKMRMKTLLWNRSHEYFGHNTSVYQTMDSGDILQGELGDCYFLAAISAIAEHPKRLQRLFLTKKNENNGLFAMALCLNGVWEEIILDDYAPCKSDGTLAFNSSQEKEL